MAGPNPHPDAKLFAQLYRLLAMYSLVSPPKGSNVQGVGNVEALLNSKDQVAEDLQKRQDEFDDILDQILELGEVLKYIFIKSDQVQSM